MLKYQRLKKHSKYTIYIVGDSYSNKSQLLKYLLVEQYQKQMFQSQNYPLNVYYSKVLGKDQWIQIFDFTSQRYLRQYLDVYFEILPKPDLILYCADSDSNQKQIQQWIQLIEDEQLSIVFLSSIKTYTEKVHLVSKLSCFFKKDVVDYIYFINCDQNSLHNCICNLNKGISLKNYIRKVGTWSLLKTFFKRLGSFIKKKPQSIV